LPNRIVVVQIVCKNLSLGYTKKLGKKIIKDILVFSFFILFELA